MKSLLLSAILSPLLSHNISTIPVANPQSLPEKCPSVQSISTEGLNYVMPFDFFGLQWLGVKENSDYDTKDNWTIFVGGNDFAHNKNGRIVLKNMLSNINKLKLKDGPYYWDKESKFAFCRYEGNGIEAYTVTPSLYT